jgi:hypothetical protein
MRYCVALGDGRRNGPDCRFWLLAGAVDCGPRGARENGADYRKAAAMLPPSTVVTSPVVFKASAWYRNA